MPRYFFHIHDELVALDDEGMELADMSAVRRQAVAGIHAMMCDQLAHGRLVLHHHLVVEDEQGVEVLSLAFGDTVAIEP
jgi:hypothetical protein